MASEIIGRCECPECGFKSAHVKLKTDKEGAQPYRYCPDCGSQYFAKGKMQGDMLRQKINGASQVKPEPSQQPEPEKPKQKMVLGVMVPA